VRPSQGTMGDQAGVLNFPSRTPSWSIRLLILALAGIAFLTLFPFRLTFHAHLATGHSPFLLGGRGKDPGLLDVFLNILLFVPFGFAVAERFRERGKSREATLLWVLALGALLSYTVEFLQLYIPLRDSGWEDVVTNSTGSVVGFVLFELSGQTILRLLTKGERPFRYLLPLSRTAWAIFLYFVLWFGISIPLQMQTRLSNWDPNALLVVGNDAAGEAAWTGAVLRLQIWNRAIPSNLARRGLAAGARSREAPANLLASYDFSGPPGLEGQTHFASNLSWTPSLQGRLDSTGAVLDGKRWLTSGTPVPNLVAAIQRTNQFAIQIVCTPAESNRSSGKIVSISKPDGPTDFEMRQQGSSLVVWLRNPLTVKHSRLAWSVPNVFSAGQKQDILLSYTGSSLTLFLDGQLDQHFYRLGPGTGLARIVRRVRPVELDGYTFIYYSFVFFVPGILLGMIATRTGPSYVLLFLFVLFGFLLPPVLFELVLAWVSGRPLSVGLMALSLLLTVAGSLWINADRKVPATR
jgi:VanZ like family